MQSVERAMQDIACEVFVVDNNSVDGSCGMVKEKFPWVTLIANKENVGFSKANNQAIRISKGRYTLLLNPDTVVQESTFRKVVSFMDNHPEGGGLGVKMIDGKGTFLPESKRGVPTPMVAFYKIFGFSKLFPKSKRFAKYHLGYLDKEETHEIEILSGAFMLMRKKVLDEIGLLDEDYFMYGEDIDLSYRIIKAGYKNYYYPETTIIHYKGESTKKGSINYVLVFYRAMIIFARKQLGAGNAKLFSFLINFAIYLRASISILNRFLKKIFYPLLDLIIIFVGFLFISPLWREQILHLKSFPMEFFTTVVPLYGFSWVFAIYFSGGYSLPANLLKVVRGLILGFILILVGYALLNESYRFSRAVILLNGFWTFTAAVLARYILSLLPINYLQLKNSKAKRIIIVGALEETERVANILEQSGMNKKVIGYVCDADETPSSYLGNISQLEEIVSIHHVEEIIFCSKDISSKQIISSMLNLPNQDIEFKIAPEESISIIGSNSINTAGDLYTIDFNSIASPESKRMKLLFDITISIVSILILPFIIWFVNKKGGFVRNIFSVLFQVKTWVGYNESIDLEKLKLPKLKPSVIHPANESVGVNATTVERENILYAKRYTLSTDFTLLASNIPLLGD